jgi:hypothetical protein
MNERIKELAEQAGFQYIKDEGIGWAGNHNSSLSKFAELLVREVFAKIDDEKFEIYQPVKESVMKHFGVKNG